MNQTLVDEKSIARKAWRDTLQDGLTELSVGIYMLLIALLLYSGTTGFVVVLIILAPPIVKRLKERYTYPRLGYVEFPSKDKNFGPLMLVLLAVAIVAIVVVILLAGDINEAREWYRWMPLLPAILFQGAFIPLGVKSGLKRYYLIAFLALILGIAFTIPIFPGRMGNLSVYLFVFGTILSIWGAGLLIRFLRRHPIPTDEAQDDK